jgi:hypothetical protein
MFGPHREAAATAVVYLLPSRSDDSPSRRVADPRESIGMQAVDRDGRIDQRRHV